MIGTKYKLWKTLVLLLLALMPALSACIKDEPAYSEADIETVTLHVAQPEAYFYQLTDSQQVVLSTDTNIVFTVRGGADVSHLSPMLTLSHGATVSPASGSTHDFSQGAVTYTVTSEDGKWQRRYTVAVIPTVKTVTDTVCYDFEAYELEPTRQRYYIWHNELADGTLGDDWATANAGFRLSMSSASPEDYPTTPLADGYDGAAVCLTTRDTGPFGRMANKRLAAGNMYLGEFDVAVATTDPLHATRFGIPTINKPVRFSGYYKYTPGEHFQDYDGNYVDGKVDSAAVYAVLYRNHDASGNEIMLYGNDILSSSNIVALARMPYVAPTDGWTAWDVEFAYREQFDWELLENMGYSLAVVFSSSARGAVFEGAVGSCLCIDKVRIICTHEQQ